MAMDGAVEDTASDEGVFGGVAASEVVGGAGVGEVVKGVDIVGADCAVFEFTAAAGAGEGDFVHAVAAVDNEDTAGAESLQSVGKHLGEVWFEDTDELA